MNVGKRISLLLASSVAVASLSGCSALEGTFDFLNFKATDKELEQTAAPAAAASPAPVTVGAINTTVTQPAPFDLNAAAPAGLPASTLNVQTSPANAALIGATTGASPSGFAGLTAGVPTTTTTTATYGAQPNPYAPRVPGTTSTTVASTMGAPSVAFQQSVATGLASPAPVVSPSIYGSTYSVGPQATVPAPAPVMVRPPSVAPITAGLPSSAVSAINAASANQPGSINPENLSKSTIVAIQTALKSRGLYSDDLDGIWGSKSKASMNAYLASRGQTAVTLDTLFSLGVSL